VADTTPMVNSLLEKYMNVRTYSSHSTLLERESLDAVLLCTPPAINYDILMAASRKGIHAFVEKPGTLSAAQAAEVAQLYEARGLVNQVGYVNRFNEVFIAVKRLIEQRAVGDVLRFRSEMFSRTVIREETGSSWRSTRDKGGGAVYEMASHAVDLTNYLFGRPDAVSGTCLSRVFSKNVEDIVSSTLLYKRGTVGLLYVNWSDDSFRKPTNKLEIFGKLGRILADQHGLKIYLSAANENLGFQAGWNSLSITDVFKNVKFFVRGNEFTAQLHDFIECVKSGGEKKTLCTLGDAAEALYVLEELFRDHMATEKVVGT
jgi:predicted dehydrogenase